MRPGVTQLTRMPIGPGTRAPSPLQIPRRRPSRRNSEARPKMHHHAGPETEDMQAIDPVLRRRICGMTACERNRIPFRLTSCMRSQSLAVIYQVNFTGCVTPALLIRNVFRFVPKAAITASTGLSRRTLGRHTLHARPIRARPEMQFEISRRTFCSGAVDIQDCDTGAFRYEPPGRSLQDLSPAGARPHPK